MEFQAAGVMLAWDGGLDTKLPMTEALSKRQHSWHWCTHRNKEAVRSHPLDQNSHIASKRPAVEAPQHWEDGTFPGTRAASPCGKAAPTRVGSQAGYPHCWPVRHPLTSMEDRRRAGVGRGQERGAKRVPWSPPHLDGWTRINKYPRENSFNY
ncbi:uncharacterized protein LOC123464685 isoform X2 [Bubalus bubalis]|uniref:uncharacterized protein LOC123464685 isoform X2 n=1 Tax=Bubalus bubalis TaxID=89462 RepID=UPI001E1B6FFB|nr:uncharacterized protein LOC123464685 isoform X2 [Bubalus bubalis]